MSRAHVSIFSSLFILVIIALFCYSILLVHAQTLGSCSVQAITLDVSPLYPAPYQNITLTPSSTTFDIAGATVSITVNGTSFYKGSGGNPVTIPMGGPGSATKIKVTATSAGQTYSQSITLRPAEVALIVEPVSTTHPFYLGTGLVGSEGSIRLVAIPDLRTSAGKSLDPATLEYTWKLGDQVLENDSGVGKSVLVATAPQRYRDADVSVLVQNSDGSLLAQAATSISPVDPVALVYLNDPLLGPLFDNALTGTFSMSDAEDTYRGVPYYFSETPTLNWTVNGVDSSTDKDLTVRSTGSGTGSAILSFSASQNDTSQSTNATLNVNFGQAKSLGFFGL
jgi:ribosomal protein L31